ncbi:MAG: NAD-dependent epimerase/dehydratase family protein [Acidimicrobiales bacterium]|nr:NAD-dependent epimerase/dehydratase family protein [Acidimicrobiales bacterium]
MTSETLRVLVMGGTQFNGLALVHELARRGHEVTILNRGVTEAPLPDGIKRLKADRSDHDQVREILSHQRFDVVVDMTAYHPRDVALMVEILDGRVDHYVFASSTVIYSATERLPIREDHPEERGDDQIEYGMHKLLCEDLLTEAHSERGFPATTVAFAMVYGPRNIIPDREQRMYARLEAGRPVLVPGDGTTVGQVGHVDDQARALEALMGNPATFGRRYNLTGRDYFTDLGYVHTTAEVLGVEPDIRFIPATFMEDLWDGLIEFESGGQSRANIDIRTSEEARRRQAAIRHRFRFTTVIPRLAPNIHRWNRNVVFSIDALRRDTGWEPQHDLASMVAHTHAWHTSTGGRDFDWSYEDQILDRLD